MSVSRLPPIARHLLWIVLLKLVALGILWWATIRPAHVGVDRQRMAGQLTAPVTVVSTKGSSHEH